MKKRKMKNQLPIQIEVVKPQLQQDIYKKLIRNCMITILFLIGNLQAFFAIFGDIKFSKIVVIFAAIIGVAVGVATQYFEEKIQWIFAIRLLPVILFFVLGPSRCFQGLQMWLNQIIRGWNRLYQSGMVLFAGEASSIYAISFAVVVSMIFGEFLWSMVNRERKVICMIYALVWMFLMLIGDSFHALPTAFMLTALIAMIMFGQSMPARRSTKIGFIVIFAVCMSGVFFVSDGKLAMIDQTRENAAHNIHELRYGKDRLPEGNLNKAYKLQEDDQNMMEVTSQDKKTLYLKAYVGSVYEDGKWEEIHASAYNGENAGILRWLKSKNFDPLRQSAQYQKLTDSKDKLDKNLVKIQIKKASRYYFYTPESLYRITDGEAKNKTDITILSKGIFGQREYTFEEISSIKPSELTVADEWVSNPQSAAQKQYSEAEEVYRAFVYDNYTKPDADLTKLINQIFWKDYDSKSDGIYSALNQVRTKLRQNYRYTKSPETAPEGKDPIEWFLTTSHKGNQMLYASAAVEAFRVHGIPARYVEGYYVGASRMEGSSHGKVSITGKNAHAWVEVYFDGIGWKAIDVTPGYYYNVATLQKMVNTPEKIKKNAALKNNGYKGKQTTDSGRRHSNAGEKAKKIVKNIAMLVVGIFMILIILGVILFAFIEIRFIILERRKAKYYENADMDQKIRILQKEIFGLFTIFGIEARLGWNTKQTDEILSSQFESIEEGDYERVCELMEKTIYGDITLELFEERTIRIFRDKLVESAQNKGWRDKIRFQYRYYKYCC